MSRDVDRDCSTVMGLSSVLPVQHHEGSPGNTTRPVLSNVCFSNFIQCSVIELHSKQDN